MRILAGTVSAILLVGLAHGAGAESTVPTDFTFKRVKVGQGLPGKRITVQIDPAEQARLLATLPKVDPDGVDVPAADPKAPEGPMQPAAPAGASYDWFWNTVPVARDQVDGRFVLAMATLSQGPAGAQVAAPRMQHMQEIADSYGTEILKATIGTEVSPALVLAVIGVESAGKPKALSTAGAVGLMQLIPDTASRFGVTDSTDPGQNIKGGVAYLDWLMKRFNRDPLMVIAAYNAGEGAVDANNGVPPFAETRDYVPKVLAAWQVAQGLCLTPPELVTDPCVFKVISADAAAGAPKG
ncbi:lytic transglycosylase domain-containing protein [Fuscibacter oryzae]|uniref:Lytic transglycosylase domain-containing protein n=1 Tax=Fuscibacter oryzae TaxID=2803939 RepID=A0A8J7MTP6_9RHOB|nr:lytic transglycosylase domain-containing protein [Fuscibacter oryzae]MBL4928810.1 lytic transglycosylase domain-containing protein [Fuscibacter oryzae]